MLSICLCVKNESERLRETLDRVFEIADEIICGIDETTSDHSEAIVNDYDGKTNKYGRLIQVKTYKYKWEDHFSKMRNECLSRATLDWILMIDGHDYLLNGINLIEKIAMNPDQFEKAGVVDGIMEDMPLENDTRTAYQRPIMFRNQFNGKAGKDGVHWELPIHNIIPNKRDERIQTKDIVFQHRQSPKRFEERKSQRKTMNVTGLKKKIKDDPKDARSMFYLARTHDEMGEWQKAIDVFADYLKISDFEEEKYHACYERATCYMKIYQEMEKNEAEKKKAKRSLKLAGSSKLSKEKEELIKNAIDSCLQCFTFVVPRNEHIILLGDIFMMTRKRFDIAAHYYRIAKAYPEPSGFIFVIRDFYTWVPYERLMKCYANMGMLQDALDSARKFLEWKPESPKVYALINKIKEKL